MPERSLDDLLDGILRLDADEVEAAHNNVELTLHQKVEAFYQGTCVVENFYEKVLLPFQVIRPTQHEEVARGLILRMASALKSLVLMNSSHHFQTAAAAARTIFELMVSLHVLSRADGAASAERLVAFTDIERYRSDNEIDCYETERERQGLPASTPPSVIKVAKRNVKAQCERVTGLKQRYFTKQQKIVGQWEWSGKRDLGSLTKSLGGVSDHSYRVHYPRLSWYAHGSSLVGIHSFSADDFQRIFFMAHDVARECAVAAAVFYAKIIRLDKIQEFRQMIEKVREAPGAALILSELECAREPKERPVPGAGHAT